MIIFDEEVLNQQVFSALGLRRFCHGSHTIKDENGRVVSECDVTDLWWAYIQPSFSPSALLAVAYKEKKNIQGAFVLSNQGYDAKENLITVCAEFPPDWSDPVTKALKNFNLFDQHGGMALDGVSYTCQIDTLACETKLEFSTPQTPSCIALEKSFYRIIKELMNLSNHNNPNDLPDFWKRHLKE